MLSHSQFSHNTATLKGGAIDYNYDRPDFQSNLTFDHNFAPYGEDISSYPIKITLDEGELEDLAPGIVREKPVRLSVRDFDDQIMNLDSQNVLSVTAMDPGVKVKGFSIQSLKNGVATFDNLVVDAQPGSQGVVLKANTKSIDQEMIETVFGEKISENLITVDFRLCQPGEQVLDGV